MTDWATPAAVLLSAGGGAILLELTKRVLDAASGRGRKRRDEVDRAWQRADREAAKRRRIEEHASLLRRLLIAAPCVDSSEIPEYPTYDKETS
ncbi:hypothetical protein [Microbacterium sp. XT11]|uniref:hypothetical protein n=1 Tax=Microbacterium sp. XT11 TaxID=367477 RepID=UPI00082EC8ED|nr:hypothetical protein [Microbacterium sp. XT11]